MAGPKNNASTDIESKVKLFAQDLTIWARVWLKNKQKEAENGDSQAAGRKTQKMKQSGNARGAIQQTEQEPVEIDVKSIAFKLDPNPDNHGRTPARQAELVSDGFSWVCWSAHMGDKARHVQMVVNDSTNAKYTLALVFGKDLEEFKKEWAQLMNAYGLKNYEGQDGWHEKDPFHLELPDSKFSRHDERSQACLDEYARLTRYEGARKNKKFEKDYEKLLKPYLEKYEQRRKQYDRNYKGQPSTPFT